MLDLRNENSKQSPNTQQNNDLNIPASSHANTFSPYLNFDPAYFPPSQPEFIFPEGAVRQRGRFELAFSQIGGACAIGASIGGATGLYRGLKVTTLAGQTGKLKRTQLINHVVKNGTSLANTLGIVALTYSAIGTLLSYVREEDDSWNTVLAATTTGLFIKSSAGLRKCAISGGIGLGLASIYCLWMNRDSLSQFKN